MDALLFVAIPASEDIDENSQFSWFHQSEQKNSSGFDNLTTLKEQFPDTQCIAVLAGQKVFETHSELRIKNRKQLEQALKFDLEDQLAADVDTLHFAYQKNQNNTLSVTVIEKTYLENVIQLFSEQGISLQQLISETSLIAQAPEEWLIIHDGQQLLLKAEQSSYKIDTNNLLLSLESLEAGLPTDIPVYTSNHFELDTPLTQFSCQEIDDYFTKICQYHANTPLLNLLQGPYSVKTPRTWRLILAVSMTILLIASSSYFYQLYENHQLQQQEATLENKITTLYKKSFPKARRIINPVSQMRSDLKKLKQQQAQTGDFIPLLAKLARTLQQYNTVKLLQLDYQKQSLHIHFSAPSLSKLEELKNNLMHQGLQAKVASINKEKGHITAQLQITRNKS